MKTLTIRLSDSLHLSLVHEAEKLGSTVSEVARKRMTEYSSSLSRDRFEIIINAQTKDITNDIKRYLKENFYNE